MTLPFRMLLSHHGKFIKNYRCWHVVSCFVTQEAFHHLRKPNPAKQLAKTLCNPLDFRTIDLSWSLCGSFVLLASALEAKFDPLCHFKIQPKRHLCRNCKAWRHFAARPQAALVALQRMGLEAKKTVFHDYLCCLSVSPLFFLPFFECSFCTFVSSTALVFSLNFMLCFCVCACARTFPPRLLWCLSFAFFCLACGNPFVCVRFGRVFSDVCCFFFCLVCVGLHSQ